MRFHHTHANHSIFHRSLVPSDVSLFDIRDHLRISFYNLSAFAAKLLWLFKKLYITVEI
jgi:hypothetical protein